MCVGPLAPKIPELPKAPTPDFAAQEREAEAKKKKQLRKEQLAKQAGRSSLLNKKTGFLGVEDDDLSNSNNITV